MIYRVAQQQEADAVWSIIEDGRAALKAIGVDQWQGGLPTRAIIDEDISSGHTRVAVDDNGNILGTLVFWTQGEEDYNHPLAGQWLTGSNQNFVALHRVAVSANAARRGVCTFMFQQAIDEARAAGIPSVRIDTHPGNIPMQKTIAKAGFTRCIEFKLSLKEEPTKDRIGFELVL